MTFHRYEVIISIVAILVIGMVADISRTMSIEASSIIPAEDIRYPIALTFDDGPYPEYTEKLLNVLDTYNVKATFFVIGRHALNHPYLIRLIDSARHEIGSHTHSHANITRLSDAGIIEELDTSRKCIEEITGKRITLFRPPGGNYNERTVKLSSKLGYTTILWSVLPGDHDENKKSKEISSYVLNETRPYSIILLHSGKQETIDALPSIIYSLKLKGYKFVIISELLKNDAKYVKKYALTASS